MGCAGSGGNKDEPKGSTNGNSGASRKQSDGEAAFFDKYSLGKKLGKGGFAQVRSCMRRKGGEDQLAVKIMDLRAPREDGHVVYNDRYRKEAVEEAGVWKHVGHHENLVGLQDAFLEHGCCFFVMELCDMSFQSYLDDGAGEPELNEQGLSKIFLQIMVGLQHVHSLSVVHRDLKPDNVIVSKQVIKLCDFGLAAVLPSKGGGLSGVYGTAPFMAPEMLKAQRYECEVDVWSIGVMSYVLFYGTFPYVPQVKSSTEMKKVIRDGKQVPEFKPAQRSSSRSAKSPVVSNAAESFSRALLSRSQEERIKSSEALKLGFLTTGSDSKESPSLRPLLAHALKAGAFENRRIDVVDGNLDPLLEQLHLKYEGCPLPKDDPQKPKPKKEPREEKPRKASTSSDVSDVCSSATGASGTSSASTPVWRTGQMSMGGRHVASVPGGGDSHSLAGSQSGVSRGTPSSLPTPNAIAN